jgi:hypothetical protein
MSSTRIQRFESLTRPKGDSKEARSTRIKTMVIVDIVVDLRSKQSQINARVHQNQKLIGCCGPINAEHGDLVSG